MSQEQDKVFFRNFALVLVGLMFLMLIFAIAGIVFGGQQTLSSTEARAQMMENTRPVAKVNRESDVPEAATEQPIQVAEATPSAEAASAAGGDGQATYQSSCLACHGSGIPGIPQFGDATAWAPRIAQGVDVLYDRAIKGYVGNSGIPMPAKGGNPSLSDDVVKAAVDYIVAGSQ